MSEQIISIQIEIYARGDHLKRTNKLINIGIVLFAWTWMLLVSQSLRSSDVGDTSNQIPGPETPGILVSKRSQNFLIRFKWMVMAMLEEACTIRGGHIFYNSIGDVSAGADPQSSISNPLVSGSHSIRDTLDPCIQSKKLQTKVFGDLFLSQGTDFQDKKQLGALLGIEIALNPTKSSTGVGERRTTGAAIDSFKQRSHADEEEVGDLDARAVNVSNQFSRVQSRRDIMNRRLEEKTAANTTPMQKKRPGRPGICEGQYDDGMSGAHGRLLARQQP
ncbi:hypothetical protein M427DRAFT_144668 [Gonapodya prolifera JEL478]|uniref:Uncharacterized protein n=1 Tax=Gonapodya prolifera (strain JEL478) TaxID=1344416 RepID=A0A139AIG2_GONPJ|nr:hypothetical protein M427DRAFT_144668 [Gonapodya prolifera JEL478]|eukprot:KXS16577.1 hypothetical protein M427DRAFT_144668 [Gonapodya prolifera JEL478]